MGAAFTPTEREAMRLLQEADGRPRFIATPAFNRLALCMFCERADVHKSPPRANFTWARITPAGRAYVIMPDVDHAR
jgi:hypothetical protein